MNAVEFNSCPQHAQDALRNSNLAKLTSQYRFTESQDYIEIFLDAWVRVMYDEMEILVKSPVALLKLRFFKNM